MVHEMIYWQECLIRIESLSVYRNILNDDVIDAFTHMCRVIANDPLLTDIGNIYYDFIYKLLNKAAQLGLKGNILRKYFLHLFLNDENVFTLACERGVPVKQTSLYQFALRDASVLAYLCQVDTKNLCDNIGSGEDIIDFIPVNDTEDPYLEELEHAKKPEDYLYAMMWRYERMGAGDMAIYRMFRVTGRGRVLTGIDQADPVSFSDIIGCETQKDIIKKNTEDFLNGLPANNMLLAGSRGSGKSSCVKALINHYADQGLRMVEVRKDQSSALQRLMNNLSRRGKFFIIFMDDLSYENSETQYKHLKSLLEGSAESRPKNVLFYATSNRRHIVRESFGDRAEPLSDEEIHSTDTVNEKLSLFDRFGITVTFPNLSQEEYIRVVEGLSQKRGLRIDSLFLAEQAVKWALSQKSISGRTARQFVDHITGEITRV